MNWLKKMFSRKIMLVTHDGGFHADDVMAYAILQEFFTQRGKRWKIIRAHRGNPLIDTADIVFDTGDTYDPQTNRYDHHQAGRAGSRENGVLYASAGLIWKHFGRELCSSESVWQYIDRSIIQELDAIDSGQNYISGLLFQDAGYTNLGNHIVNFEQQISTNKTPEQLLKTFKKATKFAREVLVRAIHSCEEFEGAFTEATEVYKNSPEKQVLVFEKNYERPTWKRLAEFPEPIYVVYPNTKTSGWKVEAVPTSPITMESRKTFPESWWGLKNEELQKITSTPDAQFCHASGFLIGTKSKESAIELARKALES